MNKRKRQLTIYILILFAILLVFYFLHHEIRSAKFSGSSPLPDNVFNNEWAFDKLWDDGNAEVALYNAERIVYGEVRKFEYSYILVKETFNREFNVKTDDYNRNDLFDVMKVNKFARIETDAYPYHYLSSLFFLRDNPSRLYKFTNGSQEWCGNTFKHFQQESGGYVYHYNSYFDQEGRGSIKLSGDAIFEDQLSYTLRTLNFREGLSFEIPVMGTQITNRAKKPVIYQSQVLVVSEKDSITGVPDSLSNDLWRIKVSLDEDRINKYWITKSYPNYLIKMTSSDGRKLQIKSIDRYAYWEIE